MPFSLKSQICVGTQGQVTWGAWMDLNYNSLGELYVDEFYPTRPDASTIIYKLQSPINYANYMGGRIAGFINVPSNDLVSFNITGDDQTRFFMSTDSSPENLELRAYADVKSMISIRHRLRT